VSPPTGEARIHFQCQALSRVGINHAQRADRPAGSDPILRKIQNLLLVGGSVLTKRCALLEEVFALPATQRQAGFSTHPAHALVVHDFSTSAQQNVQPPIAGARLLPR
jgi:hypothetical protein